MLRSCGKVALRPAVVGLTAGVGVTASRTDVAVTAALGAARGAVLADAAAQVASDAIEGAALVGVVAQSAVVSVECVGVPPFGVAAQAALGAALAGVAVGTAAAVSVGHFGARPFEQTRESERVRLSGSARLAWTGFSALAAPTSARFGVSLGVAASAVPGVGHWDCSRVFRLAACRC